MSTTEANEPLPLGGQGDWLRDALTTGKGARSTLQLISRAADQGWIGPWRINDAQRQQLIQLVLDSIERSKSANRERELLRGIEVLQKMLGDNVKLIEVVGKAADGDPDAPSAPKVIRVFRPRPITDEERAGK